MQKTVDSGKYVVVGWRRGGKRSLNIDIMADRFKMAAGGKRSRKLVMAIKGGSMTDMRRWCCGGAAAEGGWLVYVT